MAMRETEKSLRWYFWVAGILAILSGCHLLSSAWDVTGAHLSWRLMLVVPSLARIAFGGAFVFAGVKLKEALASNAAWVRRLVIVVGVAQAAELALTWLVFHDVVGSSVIVGAATVRPAIGVAIAVYLYYNLVRLSRESRGRLPAVFE